MPTHVAIAMDRRTRIRRAARSAAAASVLAGAALVLPGATREARAQAPEPPRVFILSQGGPGWPALDGLAQALADTLAAVYPSGASIFTHYLGGTSFDAPPARAALRTYLQTAYPERPDLVVTLGPPAFSFLASEDSLFAGVPAVFLGDPHDAGFAGMEGRPSTGVSDSVDLAAPLDLALQLQPDLERVYILAGNAELDLSYVERAETDLARLQDRLDLRYVVGLPMDTLEQLVGSLPERSAILYLQITRDRAGLSLTPREGIRRIVRTANRPMYAWIESHMVEGVLAARAFDLAEIGRIGAGMAVRVLQGTPANDIPPVLMPPTRSTVDWSVLERWNIDPSRVPPDATLIHRERTVWERYHVPILAALAVILFEAALIGGLLVNRARRKSAETLARRKDAELRASHDQVRDLARRLIAAQDMERTALARELHEDVNQQLAALSMRLSALHRSVPAGEADIHREIEWLQHRADLLLEAIRELSHGLHPVVIAHTGLPGVLRRIGDLVQRQHDTTVRVRSEGDFVSVPEPVALTLYRVAQEALENVVRHADARVVDVTVRRTDDRITMSIADDGKGFAAGESVGLGLVGMRERLAVIGGRLDISAEPGRGTSVLATVVLRAPYDTLAVSA